MALVIANRVQETGTAVTTVSFILTGAIQGFQTFAVIGNTNTTYYAATDASGNWEVGLGTYSTTGPTLTRTTVYASSNAGSAVTFSGTVNVFVTYPSGSAVYEDASGNVSPLGTIASATWNATTIGVAYGGTGVTTSSGANSVMLRDANQNVAVNRLNQSNTSTAAAGTTTALTAASSYSQTLTGTGGQTFTMPDATTLTTGVAFVFNNNATGTVTLQDYAAGSIGTITSGGAVELVLLSNGTTAGTWDVHGYLPEAVTWGTNALNLGTTVITNGTWNGGTIPTGYGGTGLTTFTAANNALYSTSGSALAAGTLPVAAGGTGVTSSTGTVAVVLSNSPTLVTPILGTPQSGNFSTGTFTWPTFNQNTTGTAANITASSNSTLTTLGVLSLPGSQVSGNISGNAANVTGTVAIANGGTGQTTQQAALTALSGTQTSGQYLRSNGTNTLLSAIQAADVPTLNQSTTGSAATLTTPRAIYGNNFDGSAALTQIIASTYGGTGNGFTKFSGPATAEKTFTLPDATCSILTSNAAVTVAQGGTGQTSYTDGQLLIGNTTGNTLAKATLTAGTAIGVSNGSGAITISNTGVTSNVAGTGISVSGATGAVTITNSGVTSAVAGTGVTVSGATGAVTFSIGQAVATSSNVQFNSLGVGTAGSAVAGEIRATNNVTAYYVSDIKFKENIQPITGAGEIIRAIGGNYFDWTADYIADHGGEDGYFVQKEDFGVIAQKVQKVFPKAVRTKPDGTLAVDYEKLGILAFPAIADMLDRLDAIEAKLKG